MKNPNLRLAKTGANPCYLPYLLHREECSGSVLGRSSGCRVALVTAPSQPFGLVAPLRFSSPVTAAGPRWFHTIFPLRSVTDNPAGYLFYCRCIITLRSGSVKQFFNQTSGSPPVTPNFRKKAAPPDANHADRLKPGTRAGTFNRAQLPLHLCFRPAFKTTQVRKNIAPTGHSSTATSHASQYLAGTIWNFTVMSAPFSSNTSGQMSTQIPHASHSSGSTSICIQSRLLRQRRGTKAFARMCSRLHQGDAVTGTACPVPHGTPQWCSESQALCHEANQYQCTEESADGFSFGGRRTVPLRTGFLCGVNVLEVERRFACQAVRLRA